VARVGIGLKAVAEEAAGQAVSWSSAGLNHSRTSDQSWHQDFETPPEIKGVKNSHMGIRLHEE